MRSVVLGLEAIGDDLVQFNRLKLAQMRETGLPKFIYEGYDLSPVLRRPWVAEITGPDHRYGWARTFLRGNKDYSRANSVGSRGVMVYYQLRGGPVYEVNDWTSWSRMDRYFCRVEDGKIVRITEGEVRERVG